MREILFRGKSVHNNKFIIGGTLIQTLKGVYILPTDGNVKINSETDEIVSIEAQKVIPETVSQYTGVTDKNGKQIFEGDIVCILDMFSSYHYFVIHYKNGCFGGLSFDDFIDVNLEYAIKCNDIEVIGNKWDNPELMEKRK